MSTIQISRNIVKETSVRRITNKENKGRDSFQHADKSTIKGVFSFFLEKYKPYEVLNKKFNTIRFKRLKAAVKPRVMPYSRLKFGARLFPTMLYALATARTSKRRREHKHKVKSNFDFPL